MGCRVLSEQIVLMLIIRELCGFVALYLETSEFYPTTAKEVVKVLKPGFDLIKILPSTGKAVCRGFSGLDITKAKNILGYTPTKLKDGLTCF